MIIYFSGTGNSLSVARDLAFYLNDDIIHIQNIRKIDTTQQRMIGIIYPCYYGDIPAIVKEALNENPFSSSQYIFGITVHGGDPGICLYTLQKMLKEKGSDLSYGEEILMPVNSRIMYRRVTTDIDSRVKEARNSVYKIAQEIDDHKNNSRKIKKRLIPTIASILPVISIARKFLVKKVDPDRCIKCGTCEKVCSLNNISVKKDSVNIGDNCTDCLACVHWCPKSAIGFGNRKVKKEQQYHHPDVCLNDMIIK